MGPGSLLSPSAHVRNLSCARICARDAAGRTETGETEKAQGDFAPPGLPRSRRLSQTARDGRDGRRVAHNPAMCGTLRLIRPDADRQVRSAPDGASRWPGRRTTPMQLPCNRRAVWPQEVRHIFIFALAIAVPTWLKLVRIARRSGANLDPTSTRQGSAPTRKMDRARNAMKCTHRTLTRGRWRRSARRRGCRRAARLSAGTRAAVCSGAGSWPRCAAPARRRCG